jgi:two-component system response regulator NreC
MPPHLQLAPEPNDGDADTVQALPISVVLAEDHAGLRRSLRQLLDGETDVKVIAEATDLAAVAKHVHRHQPRVLILDLNMPGGSSIETMG